MGSSGSKAAKTAVASATRKYPARTASQPAPTSAPPVTSPQTAVQAETLGATQEAQTSSTVGSESSRTQSQGFIPESNPGPTVHSQASPSDTRTEAIELDARDPAFSSRLSELGPVKPYPSLSHSSTASEAIKPPSDPSQTAALGPGNYPDPATNPAIATLTARAQIQEAVDQEKVDAGRKDFIGRQYLDIATVRRILTLRDERGVSPAEIEKNLGLKKGVVASLGRVGIVEVA